MTLSEERKESAASRSTCRIKGGWNDSSCLTALLVALAARCWRRRRRPATAVPPGRLVSRFRRLPSLFAGRVTQVSELSIPDKTGKNDYVYRYQLVRFDVEENFRGQQRKSIEVTTGQGGGDCGFHFRTGERYLVYAGESPANRAALYEHLHAHETPERSGRRFGFPAEARRSGPRRRPRGDHPRNRPRSEDQRDADSGE